MPNYNNAKIYKIVSPYCYLPYIGSTTQPLSRRMAEHRSLRNSCRSSIIISKGDAKIVLIENYPCDNKEELIKRERQIIESVDCVNKVYNHNEIQLEDFYEGAYVLEENTNYIVKGVVIHYDNLVKIINYYCKYHNYPKI